MNEGLAELVPPRRRSGIPAHSPEDAAPLPVADAASGSLRRGGSGTAAQGTATTRGAAPRGRQERDPAAVAQFIERFAGILSESGVPRMPARVFAALLASDSDRLTAAELAASLRVSPAAVSGAVRYLTQVGLAAGAGEPGSRRLFYSVPPDVWEQLMSMSDRRMARWTGVLRDGVDVLGKESPAGERVTESVRYFDFVAAELPAMLARWHEYRASRDSPPE